MAKTTSFAQIICAALIIACLFNRAHARPQQFSRPDGNLGWNQPNPQQGRPQWNQTPSDGTLGWNQRNPQQQQQQQQQQPNRQQERPQWPELPDNINNFQNNNNNINNNNNNSSTTTRTPPTATTASPAFLACMQGCATTMEYNPVCGSDGINYHNNGRLACATQCGKRDVVATRSGTCNPL